MLRVSWVVSLTVALWPSAAIDRLDRHFHVVAVQPAPALFEQLAVLGRVEIDAALGGGDADAHILAHMGQGGVDITLRGGGCHLVIERTDAGFGQCRIGVSERGEQAEQG
jgi:hypothetical protein